MESKVEYRVRPVTRYVVTRFHCDTNSKGSGHGGTDTCGEFDNHEAARRVMKALAENEANELGVMPDRCDDSIAWTISDSTLPSAEEVRGILRQ